MQRPRFRRRNRTVRRMGFMVFPAWLLSGFGVLARSGDQGGDKGAEQGFAAAAGIVDELEEAEIGGQLLLREAAVRPQPRAQQGPEALERVDVHLAKAVAILVAG